MEWWIRSVLIWSLAIVLGLGATYYFVYNDEIHEVEELEEDDDDYGSQDRIDMLPPEFLEQLLADQEHDNTMPILA